MSNEEGRTPTEEPSDESRDYAELPAWFQAEVPEFYADTLNLNIGAYGLSMTFGVRGWNGPAPKVRVFMSQEMARVLQLLTRRVLNTYEAENQITIQLPERILAELKLRDADFDELEKRRLPADDRRTEVS